MLGKRHLGNGDAGQKLVQFLVVADGQLQVTGDDPGLLVGKLQKYVWACGR